MAVKKTEIARGVRVKLNSNFEPKCLGDEYLQCEEVIFIAEGHVYNDQKGEYVNLRGGSRTNSGYAYLDQIDLEFPYDEKVLYPVYYKNDKRPLKKEFVGGTPMWDGGKGAIFFDKENLIEITLKDKNDKPGWDYYCKHLKITIEEIPSNDENS